VHTESEDMTHKVLPLVEDLRNHSPEQLAELRLLLSSGAASRPDPRRPGFFEVDGPTSIFYVFKYPAGSKILLLGVWQRDPVAELASVTSSAA
jgi:hypothetical protein